MPEQEVSGSSPVDRRGYQGVGGLVPVPDPTLLTSDFVNRAIANVEEKTAARLDAMDKAANLLHDNLTRVPTEMDRQLAHLREVVLVKVSEVTSVAMERFARIDNQFIERDKRTDQLKLADQKAIDAALQSQKEAAGENTKSMTASINKSEASFAEAIKTLQALFQSESKSTNDKIAATAAASNSAVSALTAQIASREGAIRGVADQTTTQQGSNQNMIAIIAIIAAAIMSLAVMFSHSGQAPAPLLTGMPPISRP